MKNPLKFFLSALTFLFIFPFFWRTEAASLKFDKTTVSIANGGTFQIAVNVDPAGENMNSADVYVSYDSTVLKATGVAAGSLFPYVSNDVATSGKVYIAGMVTDPASSISISGTVATITFQGLKDGNSTLSFSCDTSKIIKNDVDASNILVCSSNGTSVVTVGNGSSNPNPTAVPPNQLPESGIFDNVVKYSIPGIILLMLGSVLRLVL